MKPQDLIPGDWVQLYFGTDDERNRIAQITEIHSNSVRTNASGGDPIYFDEIIPIPLTPEILEKNGFVKQGFPGWEIYTEDFLILWRNDYPDVLDIKCFNAAYGSFHRSHISYVHDLQHALRMCRIDKEITL